MNVVGWNDWNLWDLDQKIFSPIRYFKPKIPKSLRLLEPKWRRLSAGVETSASAETGANTGNETGVKAGGGAAASTSTCLAC